MVVSAGASLLLYALGDGREVLSSLYDTRGPLARLFLWVQVIHAFDPPARKDLSYSLMSALILAAVGAVFSTSLWYGLFVLAFLLCAMRAMTQLNLSEARLYSRYKRITTALEEIGIVREPHETPKQYARRAAHEPGMNQLGEVYLYARFRNAVPSTLVEEFDRLEPQTLAAIEQLKDAQTVSMSARSS